MNVYPLRWVGRARRAELEQALQSRLAPWATQWLRADLESVLASAETGEPDPGELGWLDAVTSGGTLLIGCTSNVESRLGARLVGLAGEGGSALAPRIGRRALEALAQCLTGAIGATLSTCDAPGPKLLAPRAGALLLQLTIGDVRLYLLVDTVLCETVAPVLRRASSLVPREDALGACTASLELRLELGHADLLDVSTLRPGEVLKTTIPVGSLLSLVNPDGSVVRTGHLVARQGRRAIRIQ
ncbi:hypothetical protein ACFFGH_09075 [Lysobacter korlensis]|uniref:Flagellar motor switch protein FliN-like C-terminal domain-containing protein n=1 Tax=Lysobacter korlensis TaxID=553636 RepID=A0ABV6RLX8_9GAMM